MTNDIFNKEGEATSKPATPPTGGDDKPSFDFIGEGKKYATTDDALKSIPFAQQHIATIEKENAELKKRLDDSSKLDEVLDALKSSGDTGMGQEDVTEQTGQPDIKETIRTVLRQEQIENVARENVAVVDSKMKEIYGADKAAGVVEDKANSLGLTVEDLQQIASRSPTAFFEMFQTKEGDTTNSIEPEKNTQTTTSDDVKEGTQESFSAQIKADRKKGLSAEFQKAQMKAAMEDPEKFFGSKAA